MRRVSSEDADTVSSIEEIETPAAVAIACTEIHRFLTDIITKKDTDIVISTIRKGSWIIDDILRLRGLKIKHYTNKTVQDIPRADLVGKRILIFDDSIHSGDSITSILTSISYKIDEKNNVRVACIAINDGAVERIEKNGTKVEYLERFKEYTSYGENLNSGKTNLIWRRIKNRLSRRSNYTRTFYRTTLTDKSV